MNQHSKFVSTFIASGLPLLISHPVFADGVSQIQSFIESVIKVIVGLAGLIATGFFVAGGIKYITSAGNPENLDRAKKTITYSAIGLAITIAAFVLSSIVTTLATNAFGS